jgi:hypothetical protein
MAAKKIYMLQRVQTLYMLSALILTILLFYKDFMYSGEQTFKFVNYTPFLVLNIASIAVAVLTFALFTSRTLQMRFCTFNILILSAYQGWIIYLFCKRDPGVGFTIYSVAPIIAAILYFIAIKYLGRDEAMVQAANSLRTIHKNHKGMFSKKNKKQ